ncbi:MAG: hypothetical protein FVQ79_13870 [Planctomycetes bacterium]|nr:hypothetical protein [Planctomycetota bacterium]
MSNLTKIFIVLLSLSSIFLCGAMITFVGTTQNYKAVADDLVVLNESLETNAAVYHQRTEAKNFQMKKVTEAYAARISQLEFEMGNLTVEKRTAETLRDEYAAKVASWGGTFAGFETTIKNLNKTVELSKNELKNMRDKNIKSDSQLNELGMELYEKIVLMEQLEADLRNLREQKKSIEDRLNGLVGKGFDVSKNTVTATVSRARPAPVIPAGAPLKGLITEVAESLVTVGLGSADGVRVGMIFYVIRGDIFVCNVKVTDVDVNKSAGVLQLKVFQPKVGDSVSTEL